MYTQKELNKYFSTKWHTNIEKYLYSGPALINKIAPNESVIDVGCGTNYFKGKIANITGIDPAFSNADIVTTIEDYRPDSKYDIAFCLGSINFGSAQDISKQITAVVALLKPVSRIYWRCNPGKADHADTDCKNIDFFNWTMQQHINLSEIFGYDIADLQWDTGNRIYAEWVAKSI